MTIRIVSDLKTYLEQEKLSPEAMGGQLNISNMTIRRLLGKKPTTAIPRKYHPNFDQAEKGCHCKASETLPVWPNLGLCDGILRGVSAGTGSDYRTTDIDAWFTGVSSWEY